MSRSHFRRGQGATVFACDTCGRQTRGTPDVIGLDMCSQCYDLAGLDNEFNDDGRAPDPVELEHCNTLLAEIVAKGGDAERVKALNDYIWSE